MMSVAANKAVAGWEVEVLIMLISKFEPMSIPQVTAHLLRIRTNRKISSENRIST